MRLTPHTSVHLKFFKLNGWKRILWDLRSNFHERFTDITNNVHICFFVKFNGKIEKLFRTPNYLSTARQIRTITFCRMSVQTNVCDL